MSGTKSKPKRVRIQRRVLSLHRRVAHVEMILNRGMDVEFRDAVLAQIKDLRSDIEDERSHFRLERVGIDQRLMSVNALATPGTTFWQRFMWLLFGRGVK